MKQLDIELLSGYLDNLGKDVVQQMLNLYIEQSALYLSEISGAIESTSQELWQERCHKMKGAAGSVGLLCVHGILVDIEKSSEDWSVKRQHLMRLTKENEASIAAFTQWLA